ncbi:alkyl sulfatase dimerization domain-containing protein [Fundidesulfovibrio butyratiphilus]
MATFVCLMFCALWILFPTRSACAADQPKPASQVTLAANAKLKTLLDFGDKQDFEDATRGFVAPLPDGGKIVDAKGKPVWDMTRFAFVANQENAPDTVNPSLWRQSRLCMQGGLFKVVDGIYQIRNADLSNMTVYEGKTGIIVVDPLVSAETAKAALDLYYAQRPKKPVVAVIYSHSHVDHYGGVRGVVDEKDVVSGKVKIVAPKGFLEAAITENLLAGQAMGRRAAYMYGNLLPPSPVGQVGAGLGTTTSEGTVTLIAPTQLITHNGQTLNIDGLDFEFMLAEDSEAPAEMHWYIEQFKALTVAENCTHTLHNTYTLRGAKIRDPLSWSKYLNQALTLWGDKSVVMYGMHHWPVWGADRVKRMLALQRDAYRYINDQTLRLANLGYGPDELADAMAFPEPIQKFWALRGYYGTLYHDAKATFVKYLGWFDGNPATLHVLAPVERAKKYVEYMGGADAVLERARKDFAKGEYRFVAEVLNQVVFADPKNQAARDLEADALEQMGYQAESGPWRNFYLSGAQDLRQGRQPRPEGRATNADAMRALTTDMLFDFLGVRLDGPKSAGKRLALNLRFTDLKEDDVLILENGALSHTLKSQDKDADATLTMDRKTFLALVMGAKTVDQAVADASLAMQGDKAAFETLVSLLDRSTVWFSLVTPRNTP